MNQFKTCHISDMVPSAEIQNNSTIPLREIPVLRYEDFLEMNVKLMGNETHHCVNYFGFRYQSRIKLICCIANDSDATILISSAELESGSTKDLPSFTAKHLSFQLFERELYENLGLSYMDHPWMKPLRYAFNRTNKNDRIENYPFYKIKSDELHEVGVGPIHAGIIEPGHFRFICNGEQILHLEIQLGYQHRGVEDLFLSRKKLLQRTILAESISGDSVAGHTTAFVNLWESLCGHGADEDLKFVRTVALELERIAIHTGDLSAICADIGYQLGSAVFGRLRTPVINFFQEWCGNRLAKGLIRAGHNHFNFHRDLAIRLEKLFDDFERDFDEIWQEFHTLPTALGRLEKTGVVSPELAASIGTVGMTARASGIMRDIRITHAYGLYNHFSPITIVKHHGDVYSRTKLRHDEIIQSIFYLRRIIRQLPLVPNIREPLTIPKAESFGMSLTEGWRGEICHCAVTDETGELLHYKVKDPSMHNWLALAMAVRNNEISDFPVCNKSFDLSYCGHDL
jgi:Ni,Fe-hydrogenase III large subunit/NADH:ubiquinone oxidoreductase subunit C